MPASASTMTTCAGGVGWLQIRIPMTVFLVFIAALLAGGPRVLAARPRRGPVSAAARRPPHRAARRAYILALSSLRRLGPGGRNGCAGSLCYRLVALRPYYSTAPGRCQTGVRGW